MGRTACTEPQCPYKSALYIYLNSVDEDEVRDSPLLLQSIVPSPDDIIMKH